MSLIVTIFQESITDNVTSQRLKTKESSQLVNTYMQKIWSTVRLNNGIMVLLAMLKIRTPIIEADSVRANVCKVDKTMLLFTCFKIIFSCEDHFETKFRCNIG